MKVLKRCEGAEKVRRCQGGAQWALKYQKFFSCRWYCKPKFESKTLVVYKIIHAEYAANYFVLFSMAERDVQSEIYPILEGNFVHIRMKIWTHDNVHWTRKNRRYHETSCLRVIDRLCAINRCTRTNNTDAHHLLKMIMRESSRTNELHIDVQMASIIWDWILSPRMREKYRFPFCCILREAHATSHAC